MATRLVGRLTVAVAVLGVSVVLSPSPGGAVITEIIDASGDGSVFGFTRDSKVALEERSHLLNGYRQEQRNDV